MIEMFEARSRLWTNVYPSVDQRMIVQEFIERIAPLERLKKVILVRFQTQDKLFLIFVTPDPWGRLLLGIDENDVVLDTAWDLGMHIGSGIEATHLFTEPEFEKLIKEGSGDLKDTTQITLWTK